MRKTHYFINISFLFWFLTLIAWTFRYTTTAIILFSSSIMFLIFYFNQKKVSKMFTKKQKNVTVDTPPSVKEAEIIPVHAEPNTVSSPVMSEEKSNTIISRDVIFEGNITSNEQIHIYGKVVGNISGKGNTVKVMLNGQVIGNIISNELIVNGKIEGECISDTISIDNNGEIHGTIQYASLAIKKGGVLSGQAKVKTSSEYSGKLTVQKDKIKQDTTIPAPPIKEALSI